MQSPSQSIWPVQLEHPKEIDSDEKDLIERLRDPGFSFVDARRMRALLTHLKPEALSDWSAFAQSWETLEVDAYLVDQKRYRRRRHGTYRASRENGVVRMPHRAHFQSLDYNTLYGGMERWFEPIASDIGDSDTMRAVLQLCHATFDLLRPDTPLWDVEVHQFRIEARVGVPGEPTPEGVHRDGVDYVLVLMIDRVNISRGTTRICTADQKILSSFTLSEPLDATFLDDQCVYHGVTAVEPVDPTCPAWRDVLVVTFKTKPEGPC